MKRVLTSLASLVLAATSFATHQILYKGETQSPQPVEETISAPFYNERFDEFRYFLSDEGEKKDGEWDEAEELYTATVTNGAYRWSAVYHDPEQEDDDERPDVTNVIHVVTMPLAPDAEPPEGSGGVTVHDIFRDDTGFEDGLVTISAEALPGFEFSHWDKWNTDFSEDIEESVYSYTKDLSDQSTDVWIAYFTGTGTDETNETVTISTSVDTNGGGITSGDGTKIKGRSFSINAIPDKDHIFYEWRENGENISYEASFSGTADSDRSFVASFSPRPRTITCKPSKYFYEETQGGNIAINEAWISSAGGIPYEYGTHTVTVTKGQQVTIKAEGRSFSEARVRKASSSLHRDADRDDSWTLEHTFTVQDSEDWIVFFGKRDEILRNTGGSILCQGY